MAVPNIFATATTSIPLSQLDTNFATAITLGSTALYLGNTTTSVAGLTLTGGAFNGTVGATTPSTGAFTTLSATGLTTLGSATDVRVNIDRASDATSYGLITLNGAYASTTASGIFGRNTGGDAGKLYVTGIGNVFTQIAGVTVTNATSTGLSITKDLYVNDAASSPTGGIYLGQSGFRASILWNVTTGNLDITPRSGFTTSITAGGLAVTGTLSATTSITSIGSVGNVSTDSTGARLNFSRGADNYFQATTAGGYFAWIVNNTGTNAMTLDSSGTLGLKVTPSGSSAGAQTQLQIGGSSGLSTFYGQSNDYACGVISAAYFNSSSQSVYAATSKAVSEIYLYNGDIIFRNAAAGTAGNTFTPTERARIDTSGNLLLGNTATNTTVSNLILNGATRWGVGTQSGGNIFYIVRDSDGVGQYMVNGSTAWTAASDERLKDIIEPITDAANKVSTLRAVIGKFKKDAEGTRRSFLIAQDVQAVLPEAVTVQEDEFGTLGVQYTEVIPLLVAAIKEQQAIITALTTRTTALEAK